jgi:signal transduction histidine kinase
VSATEPELLARACEDLSRFISAARDACVLGWDDGPQPRIAAARGSVRAVLAAEREQIEGRDAGALFAGGERAARDLALAAAHGPIEEHRTLLRAGRPFPAQLLLSPAPGGVVALVRDVAATQAAADAAQRVDDLARFASLVAHEVRNPLTAVKIALQTLERHGSLAQNDLRRMRIALREVLNIELLLNEVLEFARPPSASLVPGDPREPVRDAVAGVEAEWAGRGISFRCDLPERMTPVSLDPLRVRTAVKILCRQAAVAAEEAGGGAVEVAIRARETRWELTVKDPGRPMPKELREKAFVPFTPDRARGTGLGLAVVARIAGEHKGEARFLEAAHGNVISVTFTA